MECFLLRIILDESVRLEFPKEFSISTFTTITPYSTHLTLTTPTLPPLGMGGCGAQNYNTQLKSPETKSA